jgi:hypothetical protein
MDINMEKQDDINESGTPKLGFIKRLLKYSTISDSRNPPQWKEETYRFGKLFYAVRWINYYTHPLHSFDQFKYNWRLRSYKGFWSLNWQHTRAPRQHEINKDQEVQEQDSVA